MSCVGCNPHDSVSVRVALVDQCVIGSIDGDGSLPSTSWNLRLRRPRGDAERRVEGAGGRVVGNQTEGRALEVVPVDPKDVAGLEQVVRFDRKWIASISVSDLREGTQLQRWCNEIVDSPHSAGAVEWVRVLAQGKSCSKVECGPVLALPPAILGGDIMCIGGEDVIRGAEVHVADHEDVGDSGDVVVRNALRSPDGRLARGVREHVEDPGLRRVGDEEGLTTCVDTAVFSIEATMILR
mmetsp:Transcript_349/g.767  ORF Transcript_349/g.767 Transcript_349/m.767 type:complete len:239 (+) Transcript_349:628-1344(+)